MRKILPATLLFVVLLLQIVAVYRFVADRDHYIFDFAHGWYGARAMLLEHRNPYLREVTEEIQMTVVGRPVAPGRCQQRFLYPPFLAFAVPHFLLPYKLGLSVWLVTLQVLLVAAVWLIVRCASGDRDSSSAHLLLLTLGAVTFRYSLLNFGYGQFSILVLFWLAITWWLWNREQFLLAGIALALVATKPQLALLLILMWLTLAVARKRWRFVGGWAAATVLLLVLPSLFAGNWIPAFLDGLAEAVSTCQPPVYQGSSMVARLGVFAVLAGALLALTLLSERCWVGQQPGYLLSLGIAVSLFSTPYIHSYDLVLALLPLLYGLVVLRKLQGTGARLLEAAFWACLVILPWVFWAAAPGHQPDWIERWLLPLIMLVLLAGLALVQRKQASAASVHTEH